MYDIVLGKTGSKYILIAQSAELDITVRITPVNVTFHAYIHDTENENIKKYIEKLGFNYNIQYWSGRFMVGTKLNKLIVIGGILYALTDVVQWTTPWPDSKLLFSV